MKLASVKTFIVGFLTCCIFFAQLAFAGDGSELDRYEPSSRKDILNLDRYRPRCDKDTLNLVMKYTRTIVTDLGRTCIIRGRTGAPARGRLYRITEILPFSRVDSIVSDAHLLEVLFNYGKLAATTNIPALGKEYIDDTHLKAVLCFFGWPIETSKDACLPVNGRARFIGQPSVVEIAPVHEIGIMSARPTAER